MLLCSVCVRVRACVYAIARVRVSVRARVRARVLARACASVRACVRACLREGVCWGWVEVETEGGSVQVACTGFG